MVAASHSAPGLSADRDATQRTMAIAALAIAALSGIAVATLAIVTETSAVAREASAAVRILDDAGRLCSLSGTATPDRLTTR